MSAARSLARGFLRATGWRAEGQRPRARRFVVVAAPHTSNWDLAYLLALAQVFEVSMSWMGKVELFHGPMGSVMRRLGGVAIRRNERAGVVEQMCREFEVREDFALVVPAEATRSLAPYWRSGFYQIARAARVPIVLGYLDYGRKVGGFGPEIMATGDIARDMGVVRAFYADKSGRHPENFAVPRLREEKEVASGGLD